MKYLIGFVLLVLCSMPNLFAYDALKTAELKHHLDKVAAKLYGECDANQDDLSVCVQLVLENADPNVCSNHFPTLSPFSVLHTAAVCGNVEMIDFFVQHGAIVETNGWTPLVAAAGFGCEEAITRLLQLGAIIEHKSIKNLPLLEATKKRHINAMIRLLNAGASPYQRGGTTGGRNQQPTLRKMKQRHFWILIVLSYKLLQRQVRFLWL